ncbi:MBL fold metallo-hydrolase [bacterium]|nr:MBL fold metallo-hydrolase [bacterium]
MYPSLNPGANMPGETGIMTVCPLASGSKGNAYWIDTGDTAILVDAGISLRQLTRRTAEIERRLEQVEHVFITHEHADHIKGLQVFFKRFRPTLWASRGTLRRLRPVIPEGLNVRMLNGHVEEASGFRVEAVKVSHDADDPLAYRFECGDRSVAVITDLGDWGEREARLASGADVFICEANHDIHMLQSGPYPAFLKARVRSPRGHLSNLQGANLSLTAVQRGTKHIVLSHLSEQNNSPSLALDVFMQALERHSANVVLEAAAQHTLGPYIQLPFKPGTIRDKQTVHSWKGDV